MRIFLVEQLAIAANYTLAMARSLARDERNQVTLIMAGEREIPRVAGIRLVRSFEGSYDGSIVNKTTKYLRSLQQLCTLVREERPDILHLQWFSLPWVEAFLIPVFRRHARVVVTVHDVVPFHVRPLELASLRRIYRSADAIVVHTDSCKREFLEVYGDRRDVFVVGQGQYSKGDAVKPSRIVSRRALSIPDDKVVFLFFGQIRRAKGLDLLIRAFGQVRQRFPNAFLLVAGRFAHVDPEEYERLVRENTTPGSSLVSFGLVAEEDVPLYFGAADVLCLPYRQIFQSGVAQIGLVYEMPIIVSDVGEMSRIVTSGVNGLLIPPEDVEALVGAMSRMCDDPDLLARCREGAQHVEESAYSVDARVENTIEAYRAALGSECQTDTVYLTR